MFLKLKEVAIGYQTELLRDATASLSLGEVCLLIGNNGTGKTTLIKSLLKQSALLKGEICIDEKNIFNLNRDEIAHQVAVVFSKSSLPSYYTVHDLISLGKYVHYTYYFKLSDEDVVEVDEIIEKLQLTNFKNTELNKLSDGNLQKAFIGRALSQNSPFIILDEPTTHLDDENKIMVLQLLRDLAENSNKLILFSSHDWRLAKEFADKIWYIKDNSMHCGVAEDIILAHAELSRPQMFNIHERFKPPNIVAPELLKELLYSYLQKNYKTDLSDSSFLWKDSRWHISHQDSKLVARNFEEILQMLPKY